MQKALQIGCVLLCAVGSASGETVVIANTGQPVPEGDGAYLTFTHPAWNAFVRLGFRSDLSVTSGGPDDDRAIYRADHTGATLICRTDSPPPDGNGRFFALSTPALSNANQIVFRGDAKDTALGALDSVGIYSSANGGALHQFVRGNDPAPDGNGRFLIMSDKPMLDDNAVTAFWASFTGTSGSFSDDTAVVMHGWGLTTILAREGQTAPDGDGQFSGFMDDIAQNQNQAVAFKASLRNTSLGNDNDTGVFRAQPGPLRIQLVREGDAPPDANGEYSSLHLGPICNDLDGGRATFRAWLRDTSGGNTDDSGVFLATTTGVVRIARDGQAPPDGNGLYGTFQSDTQNDTRVAFVTAMRNTAGGSADEHGIYWGNGLSTHKIVRGGEIPPDGNGVLWAFSGPVMNKYGHVAFKARLTGTSGGSSDYDGLYIGNGYDTVKVARTGDPLLGSTITDLSMAEGANCRNGFNRHAQVAYRAVLADGREALVLFTPQIELKDAGGGWELLANWTLSIRPDEMYDVRIAPPGGGGVSGPRTDAKAKSLTIGAAAGSPTTLSLTGGGDVSVANTCTVMPTGNVEIGAGRTLAAADIINQGAVTFQRGTGNVFGEAGNSPGGTIVVPADAEAWMHDHLHNQGVVDVALGAGIHLGGLTGNGCSGGGTTWLGGEVRPGTSIGLMNFGGDVVFGVRSFTYIELNGRAALPEFDQIVVGDDLTLDGSLVLEWDTVPAWLTPGQSLEIIDVMGAAAGWFVGLDEGDQVAIFDGVPLHITYAGGDGNDVELYAVPEPATLMLIAVGVLPILSGLKRKAKIRRGGRS